MRRTFLLLLILFGAICCNPQKDNITTERETIVNFTEKDIPTPTKVNGRKLNFEEFLVPRHILYLDNHLIIAQNSNQESDLFYLYNMETESFIGSIGKKGFGPGEVVQSTGLEQGFSEGEFFTYDGNRRTLNFFNIHGFRTTKIVQTQLKAPGNMNLVTEATLTSPSSFIIKTANTWKKLAEINLEGDTLNTYGTWKNMLDRKGLPPFCVSHICQGSLASSRNRRYVGISGVLKDFIEIFNTETGKRLFITGPLNQDPKFKLQHYNGNSFPVFEHPTPHQYTQLYLQEDSFFVLYIGQEINQKETVPSNLRIFQFDYQGNFINNFQLNYPILSFSMDEKNKMLYAITRDQNPNIAVFDLSKYL